MKLIARITLILFATLCLLPALAGDYEEGHAIADDGTKIYYRVYGNPDGPNVFMGPHFYASLRLTMLEDQGLKDPTDRWIDGLKDKYRLILANHPRGMGNTPNPVGMKNSPEFTVKEYELIADAAGAETFAWIGYSYGAAVGVQMAARSDRVTALMAGGFPPLNAPFEQMLWVTTDMAESASEMFPDMETNEKLMYQSVGFYKPLVDWPERLEVAKIDIPRMVFIGDDDRAQGVPPKYETPLADQIREVEIDLREMGWEIHWISDAGHLKAIEPDRALPIIRTFLDKTFDQ